MEIVGRSRRMDDLHVSFPQNIFVIVITFDDRIVLTAELEVSLCPARRMLWPLAIIAMG
jgi:hypothetical protein